MKGNQFQIFQRNSGDICVYVEVDIIDKLIGQK